MKRFSRILLVMLLLSSAASGALADVNEILTFTNLTDEELYVELSIFDDTDHYIYDLYVKPYHTSIADFWADTVDATYAACAYGEITGDDYGCITGGTSDYHNNVYFDDTGLPPYTSGPSDLPTEWFIFENPYIETSAVAMDAQVSAGGSGSCFISTLF
jgi:hypothetical protein